MNGMFHQPVMVKEVLEALDCRPNRNYVDATVGGGGHALEILTLTCPEGKLLGIDLDSEAIRAASLKLMPFGERVILMRGNYRELKEIMARASWEKADGILFDLGASYDQLTSPERGFSFRHPSRLDMRYDRNAPLEAHEIVNRYPESEISNILRDFGEERWARRIARRICQARLERPIETTTELASIVSQAIPGKDRRRRVHPATRTFQALRIRTNDELTNLRIALDRAPDLLSPGGRICALSYHSLEDRIVKRAFLEYAPRFRVITRKPIRPSEEEVAANPKARSAKLRVAERVE